MISADRLLRPAAPRVTLDQPLEHLVACHERIEDRLRTLERAAEALETRPEEARNALAAVFRHFDTAGVMHTRDEEESVFPRLALRMTEAEREALEALEAQHREAEDLYQRLRDVPEPGADPAAWRAVAAEFCRHYRAHIAVENSDLIGAARRLLDDSALAGIAAEMKRRRA